MAGVFFTETICTEIKSRFSEINNVNEFASLLNYIENTLYNPKKELFPITFTHLYNLSKTKDSRYKEFQILKKNGELRQLSTPDSLLKRVQNLINILLQIIFQNHSHYCSNGFLIGKDIKRNAIPHTNKKFVLNIDIKDFFPSVNFRRIKVVLEFSPFNLTGNREKIAFIIANIGTYLDALPQGAPTSPILSNIITQRLDRKISKFCIQSKVKYSRYADDLSFSSNKDVFNAHFIESICEILTEENFEINDKKTRIRTNRESQQVTGLIVNEKVNIKKEYLQKVRAMLNNWEKGGMFYAEQIFKKHQPLNKVNYNFKSVLLGHLSFLQLIKGEDHPQVRKMRLQYLFLSNSIDYDFIEHDGVKNKLREDNIKMERIFFEKDNPDQKFISFCTSAFHQIENLINYYYWKKFPNIEDLITELIHKNEFFNFKFEVAKSKFKKISDFNINWLVYLYEKDFFFDKKIYYDKHLTRLREIRNDESHRCSIIGVDIKKLTDDFLKIELEIQDKINRNKNPALQPKQQKIVQNYETLVFLEQKNYNSVRKNLKDMSNNLKQYFA